MNKVFWILILLFSRLISSGSDHPTVRMVSFSPHIILQIDALLDYYRSHSLDDPLCTGPQSAGRTAVLMRVKTILTPHLQQQALPINLLRKALDIQPLNSSGRVRLTRYAAFTVDGRRQPEADFNSPLLDLPGDEQGLSEADAEKRRHKLLRYRFSKQEILAGALPVDQTRPLAWLKRHDFEDALLQGSVQVRFDDGQRVLFNVSRSNRIPYISGLKAARQKRYWFFKPVHQALGYGLWSEWQLPIYPMAALAGDLNRFGLGTVVLMESPTRTILAVLADTGGAFTNNDTQLDLFLGNPKSREEYRKLNRSLPEQVSAFVLQERLE